MTVRYTPSTAVRPVPEVTPFFHEASHTWTYLVVDSATSRCAIVDPVMDFDQASGDTGFAAADAIVAEVHGRGLTLDWILETHVHADHLSAAPYLQEALGGRIGIGAGITEVQDTFGKVFNEGTEFQRDGSQFDRLFEDGDPFEIGALEVQAWHTPGHTPACMSFVVGDAVFVGDTLFMPDSGTARVDFPGGDARTLFRSIRRILSLPGDTRLFLCHDYGGEGRQVQCMTTVAEERHSNVHVRDGIEISEFVALREARDRSLAMPRLILPSLQVNMRAGRLPPADEDGRVFLKLPVNGL